MFSTTTYGNVTAPYGQSSAPLSTTYGTTTSYGASTTYGASSTMVLPPPKWQGGSASTYGVTTTGASSKMVLPPPKWQGGPASTCGVATTGTSSNIVLAPPMWREGPPSGSTTTFSTKTSYTPGQRINYTARKDGKKYAGSVVSQTPAGGLKIKLDGGDIKDVAPADIFRVSLAQIGGSLNVPSTRDVPSTLDVPLTREAKVLKTFSLGKKAVGGKTLGKKSVGQSPVKQSFEAVTYAAPTPAVANAFTPKPVATKTVSQPATARTVAPMPAMI
mmetsp:Transcript_68989/g.108898  ORF Transcript_68989/g.108898 Transcript_68989/m.108898 type:complete len:274 (-) Transcript_68989:213-1034(-)